MNIIEEIESIKVRINSEMSELERQLNLLSVAASKIGHKVGTIRMVAGEYKIIKDLDTAEQSPAPPTVVMSAEAQTSAPPVQRKQTTKRSYTCGAGRRALRAIDTGRCSVADIAKIVYGDSSKANVQRTYTLLYDIVRRGQANKVIIRKKTEQVSAWSLTQKGRKLLESAYD